MPDSIRVWVCPHPECNGWYGSSDMADLARTPNIRSAMRNAADEDPSHWGAVSGMRAECQACKQQGRTNQDGTPVVRQLRLFVDVDAIGSYTGKAVQTILADEKQAQARS